MHVINGMATVQPPRMARCLAQVRKERPGGESGPSHHRIADTTVSGSRGVSGTQDTGSTKAPSLTQYHHSDIPYQRQRPTRNPLPSPPLNPPRCASASLEAPLSLTAPARPRFRHPRMTLEQHLAIDDTIRALDGVVEAGRLVSYRGQGIDFAIADLRVLAAALPPRRAAKLYVEISRLWSVAR